MVQDKGSDEMIYSDMDSEEEGNDDNDSKSNNSEEVTIPTMLDF